MYLEIFQANFAVFRVFLGISRDFAEIPEFRGFATARNIRSPGMWMITTLTMIPFTSLFMLTMKKTPWIYLVWSFTCTSTQ